MQEVVQAIAPHPAAPGSSSGISSFSGVSAKENQGQPPSNAPQTGGQTNDHPSGPKQERPRPLARLLRSAASLAEALDFDLEERITDAYLHAQPPLHPRRTLDQSHYGVLRSTGARDRDQVVHRASSFRKHECTSCNNVLPEKVKLCATKSQHHIYHRDPKHETCDKDPKHKTCNHECHMCHKCHMCIEEAKRLSRVLMVDQLWMWVLDERTIITSFPQRWSTLSPDPNAVHRSVRNRIAALPAHTDLSVWELALLIIDECSRVFFDRTRASLSRPPNLIELFTEAIRGTTYKQTAAFDRFLRYVHIASREQAKIYGRTGHTWATGSTCNTLLNINLEGHLLKEIMVILDELHIILHIKRQQKTVIEAFVKTLRANLMPKLRKTSEEKGDKGFREWRLRHNTDMEEGFNVDRRTLAKANQLLEDADGRIVELETLKDNAKRTTEALKDLLTLKQQQAGVIETREAIEQSAETLNQGQSIVVFTVFTIIFLPLSFMATLFGMNVSDFSPSKEDEALPWTLLQQFALMFPISAAIIVISIVFAFNRTIFTNPTAIYLRSNLSFAWNCTTTWILVHSGMYMVGRRLSKKAFSLRKATAKHTDTMKSEELLKVNNPKQGLFRRPGVRRTESDVSSV